MRELLSTETHSWVGGSKVPDGWKKDVASTEILERRITDFGTAKVSLNQNKARLSSKRDLNQILYRCVYRLWVTHGIGRTGYSAHGSGSTGTLQSPLNQRNH
ncbi:hypothetical protein CHS0354_042217 [Potamilus streckersoni]|uniref:Uncharacterized protein n=1 Tax=Potamilus streckersoni TaxID=2493646 RepID=A0AAE0WFX7_9BIVA|nr:hypothetical protein CHS0354_042217 [Potamilus streckersoni]